MNDTLQSVLRRNFGSSIRNRGEAYVREGAVTITRLDESGLEARVQGESLYDVRLWRDHGEVQGKCTCPFSSGWGPCKHMWAAILVADRQHSEQVRRLLGALSKPEKEPAPADEPDETINFEALMKNMPAALRRLMPPAPAPAPKPPAIPAWKNTLQEVHYLDRGDRGPEAWLAKEQILYAVSDASVGPVSLHIFSRAPKRDGQWGKTKARPIADRHLPHLTDPADRQILMTLCGAGDENSYWYREKTGQSRFRLSRALADHLLPQIAATGRLRLETRDSYARDAELVEIAFDDGEPWKLALELVPGNGSFRVAPRLRRGGQTRKIDDATLCEGWVISDDALARFDDRGGRRWLMFLRDQRRELRVPTSQGEAFVEELLQTSGTPELVLPLTLQYRELRVAPGFRLTVKSTDDDLDAQLEFSYADRWVADWRSDREYVREARLLVVRDTVAEQRASERLKELGFREQLEYGQPRHWRLLPRKLPVAVRSLLTEGWQVLAEGVKYRQPGSVTTRIASGIDWFELHGQADFEGQTLGLPQLLAAVRKGERFVTLGDGSLGILPEEWLAQYGLLAKLAQPHEGHVRFRQSQAAMLDALLAERGEVDCDEVFDRVRRELRSFQNVAPGDAPAGFVGELRAYQREGLGWLDFLRRFGFGGCLADDMGLGKTVQVLAMLESRRALREAAGGAERPGPSLVVVPRSLIFNWTKEASRFAPRMRVLDQSGPDRREGTDHLHDYDLVLMTYGTLRRDIEQLKDFTFDYVILDEAQTIKNAATASAKAARLLKAGQRLCMSGTPIENHLGELWSQFEFLNPGMLGSSSVLKVGAGSTVDEGTRNVLARALRPFILRRTKGQVARDLPDRTEQTLYCELDAEQRKLYNELRNHYRQSLLARVAQDGMGKSKMHVLEALLRLRQVACHPGLVDPSRADQTSAKLETLLPQLAEVLEENHKVLVFSQFTSLLSIVRKRLDGDGVAYEYLDGQTTDRQAKVDHFQNDPDCKLFLISLKAGGLGLNLTAAEYVFLLDPWWNPAVEAQAIDRAHRIGQTRQVFAYRLIARDTVEERVLELQQSKRDLADSIINADNSLIRTLKPEDLQLLLS